VRGIERTALLVIALATIACSSPSASPAKPSAGGQSAAVSGNVTNGRQLFQAKGCIACHAAPGVPGATGTIGPNLAGIGDPNKRPTLADGAANTPEHLRTWIQDPQSLKPGTMMPNLNLTEQEADDLVALLQTLR
jgi:cytochrome c2